MVTCCAVRSGKRVWSCECNSKGKVSRISRSKLIFTDSYSPTLTEGLGISVTFCWLQWAVLGGMDAIVLPNSL